MSDSNEAAKIRQAAAYVRSMLVGLEPSEITRERVRTSATAVAHQLGIKFQPSGSNDPPPVIKSIMDAVGVKYFSPTG